MASVLKKYPNVHVLPQTNLLLSAMTIIRDQSTKREDFIFNSERVIRLLIDDALNRLPFVEKTVISPTGEEFHGQTPVGGIVGVSIMRAGESMEMALREVCRSIRIGKILIQRDEATALPKLFYSKLPPDVASRTVLLLDPMLATGGSAIKAIEVLIQHGVEQGKILFVNLVSCPEGIEALMQAYPKITIVTAAVDEKLNAQKYILPGLGDFGCRFFGTDQ
jgi:uracil phosphoribosyltransferase